jgi:hypothetical protein
MKVKFSIGFAILAVLLLAACSKKRPASDPGSASMAKPKAVSMEELASQPGNAPPPPPPVNAAEPTAVESPSEGVTTTPGKPIDPIAAFNVALKKWAEDYNLVPADLDALKQQAQTFPGLPPLPAPPTGRRLVYTYDKQTMEPRTVMIKIE